LIINLKLECQRQRQLCLWQAPLAAKRGLC
jgi:hypothetical protein